MKSARIGRSVAALGLFLAWTRFGAAQAPVQITEFPIGGNPIPIAVGSDGNFWTWFSGTTSIARMTPTGVVTGFTSPVAFPGATPGHCVDGHDGAVWCATFGPIVRISISTGAASAFPLPPGQGAGDLTLGPDGALWFTDFSTNVVGRMTVAGAITEYPMPAGFAPRSITVGPDGALWFSGNTAVGRLDTTGGGFLSYDLPHPPVPTSAIAAGSGQNLWLGVTSNVGPPQRIARVGIGGQVAEFPLTNPASSGVLDIVAGPDGAMWFTDEQANEIARISPSGILTEFPLQPLSGPVGITVGPDRAIWFTELAGRIGRLSGGPLAAAAIPTLTTDILMFLAAALAAAGFLLVRTRP